MSATRIVQRNWLVLWRGWRGSLLLSILGPLMFLAAMGLGLGSLIEERRAFGGVAYLSFFATGMLAATSMQTGVFGATYPIMSKITWQRNYEAMLASPLSVKDIFFGELASIGLNVAQVCVPFFAIMALFGIVDSYTALLAIPFAILIGVSSASVVFALTATLQTDQAYTPLFRLILTPLFLLSGTFFPIEELPSWGQVAAHATPLFHGVQLVRQAAFRELELSAVWHLAYLFALLGIGVGIGIRNLERRLLP